MEGFFCDVVGIDFVFSGQLGNIMYCVNDFCLIVVIDVELEGEDGVIS